MVVQKYSTILQPVVLPPKQWVFLCCVGAGWITAWILEVHVPEFLPVAVVAAMLCLAGALLKELRTTAFVATAVAIGVGTGARMNQSLLERSLDGAVMLAWIDGTIEEVVRITPRNYQLIVVAKVDPKFLPPLYPVRVLLSTPNLPTTPFAGDRIAGTVHVRSPRRAWFPGEYSERQYCVARSIDLVAQSVQTPALLPSSASYSVIEQWRQTLSKRAEALFINRDALELAEVLVLGKRDRLGKLTREVFAQTGTAHVLSVSGFHVGVIAIIVLLLTAPLSNRRLLRACIAIAMTWTYVVFSGAEPPAVRAGLAFTLATVALTVQRWITAFQLVAVSVFIMLVVEPTLLLSASFQLSVSAMIGITTLGRILILRLASALPVTLLRWATKLFLTTVAATIFTAPVVAYYFGDIPLLGIVANIAIVPMATAFIVATIVALAFGLISVPVGAFYASVSDVLADSILGILRPLSSIDGATIHSDVAVPITCILIAVALYLATSRSVRHSFFRTAVSIALAIPLMIVVQSWRASTQWQAKSAGIAVMMRSLGTNAVAIKVSQYTSNPDWHDFLRTLNRYIMRYQAHTVYLLAPTTIERSYLMERLRHRITAGQLKILPDTTTFAGIFQ